VREWQPNPISVRSDVQSFSNDSPRLKCFKVVISAVLITGSGGCALFASRPSYPEDPLLLSKKPVEGKSGKTESVLLAQNEPVLPTLPNEALALTLPVPPAKVLGQGTSPSSAEAPSRPQTPVVAQPAIHPKLTGSVRALPVGRRKAVGVYGHAEDYSWLQGVFRFRATGGCELCFRETAGEDSVSGKVSLSQDGCLAQLRSGDIVLVEGEFVSERAPDNPAKPPVYHVRQLWLIREDR
jgi:hypothetical protein